jgi:hypothetical protein
LIVPHQVVAACLLYLIKDTRIILVVFKLVRKLYELVYQLIRLELVLGYRLLGYRLLDERDEEDLVLDGKVAVVAQHWHEVLGIVDKIVVPGVLV